MTERELAEHPLTSELAACGNLFHQWQWSLSSSSNYSALLDSESVIISRSGVDKQYMKSSDFMLVDFNSKAKPPFEAMRPSAETELHCHLYRIAAKQPHPIKAVLHTHSKFAVYFSRRCLASGAIVFTGFEMQKIFEGVSTHESIVEIPVFRNSQHMPDITRALDVHQEKNSFPPAYLIEGHGMYAWGKTVLHAKQKLEALEYLLELKYMEEK